MNKLGYTIGMLCISFGLQAKQYVDRPLAEAPRKLSAFKNFIRDFEDFIGLEHLGFQSLSKKNEQFIKDQMAVLDMQDYCIEIRNMSNLAQLAFGRTEAIVIPSILFGKKSHSYLLICEDWLESLPKQEKEAFVRRELLQIKLAHVQKKFYLWLAHVIGINLMSYSIHEGIERFSSQDNAQNYHKACSHGCALLGLISILLQSKYSRSCVLEADSEAAKTMPNTQGILDLLANIKAHRKDPISRFGLKQFVADSVLMVLKPFIYIANLFSCYPKLDDRTEHIQNLQ